MWIESSKQRIIRGSLEFSPSWTDSGLLAICLVNWSSSLPVDASGTEIICSAQYKNMLNITPFPNLFVYKSFYLPSEYIEIARGPSLSCKACDFNTLPDSPSTIPILESVVRMNNSSAIESRLDTDFVEGETPVMVLLNPFHVIELTGQLPNAWLVINSIDNILTSRTAICKCSVDKSWSE